MHIHYDAKNDLLYLRFDEKKQRVINRRISENVVLDVGKRQQIVGIEILDASKSLRLEQLLPVTYKVS